MVVRSDGCIAQKYTIPKRRYQSFCVVASDAPAHTSANLNKTIDDLSRNGWTIERIDCHDNVFGIWKGDERKYYPTKDYIILAYVEN